MSDETTAALPPHVIEHWRRALERGEPRALEAAYALELSLEQDAVPTSQLPRKPAAGAKAQLADEVSAMLESAHDRYDALKWGTWRGVELGNPNLFAFERRAEDEELLLVYNLTGASQPVKFGGYAGTRGWDILNRVEFVFPVRAQLEPYEFLWLMVDTEIASPSES